MQYLYLATAFIFLCHLSLFGQPGWEVNPSQFEFTMTVTGVAVIDCEESVDENDIVAAFVNGELRGVQALNTDDQGRKFAYMIIYENDFSGIEVSFKIYDASLDTVFEAQQSLLFAENGIVGYSDAPFVFNTDYNLSGTFLTRDSIDQFAVNGNIVTEMHTINEIEDTVSIGYDFLDDAFGPDNHSFTIAGNLLILEDDVNVDLKTSYQIHIVSSTADGCSRNDVFTLPVTGQEITAINELQSANQDNGVLIYPNPATTFIHLAGEKAIDIVSIYSADGKPLKIYRNLSGSREIDISTLRPGLYLVEWIGDGKRMVEKVIVI